MIQFKLPKAARFVTRDACGKVEFWQSKPVKHGHVWRTINGYTAWTSADQELFTGIRKMQSIELKPKKKGKK
jgi:hypothetical protein